MMLASPFLNAAAVVSLPRLSAHLASAACTSTLNLLSQNLLQALKGQARPVTSIIDTKGKRIDKVSSVRGAQ